MQRHTLDGIAWRRGVNGRKSCEVCDMPVTMEGIGLGTRRDLKTFQSGEKAILVKHNDTMSHNTGCVHAIWIIWPVAIFWWRSDSRLTVYVNLWLNHSVATYKAINNNNDDLCCLKVRHNNMPLNDVKHKQTSLPTNKRSSGFSCSITLRTVHFYTRLLSISICAVYHFPLEVCFLGYRWL